MTSLSQNKQKRRYSLKPYVYPRCYDIPESFEKQILAKTKFFNSRLLTSQRQTQILSQVDTFRDIDEIDNDINRGQVKHHKKLSQISDNDRFEEDEKMTTSLFSRINRLYSLNNSREKKNKLQQFIPYSQRISQETDKNFKSFTQRNSNFSQNSYQRLKQLYQLLPNEYPIQSVEINECIPYQDMSKTVYMKNKDTNKFMVESLNIHNCINNTSLNNKIILNESQDTSNDKGIQTNTIFSGFHSTKKNHQISDFVQRNTKQMQSSLYTKLKNLKQKKQKRNPLLGCGNFEYS